MYIYFSADCPSAVKLGGTYLGTVDNTVKGCKAELSEKIFTEICPLGNSAPVNFLLCEQIFQNPPDRLCVTDLKGGFLIKYLHSPPTKTFKILTQKRFNACVCTAYAESGIKICLENNTDFIVDAFDFENCEVFFDNYGTFAENYLAATFRTDKGNFAALYRISDKINRIFFEEAENFGFGKGFDKAFYTVNTLKDVAKHRVTRYFSLPSALETSREVKCADNFDVNALSPQILPYAFFEELCVGGDLTEYLGENMLQNAGRIKEYTGEYIGVMPPPAFRNPDEIGLIFRRGERRYSVEYFRVEFSARKIVNIKKSD